jgi:multiple sugar transport system permease protein
MSRTARDASVVTEAPHREVPAGPAQAPPRRPARRSPVRLLLGLAGVAVVFTALFPVLFMLRIALTAPADYQQMPVDWLGAVYTESFRTVLSGDFPRYMLNSFLIAVVTTVLVALCGALAGHALARVRSQRKDHFLFFVLSTRMGPAVVFALPIFLMATQLRLVDTYIGIVVVYVFYSLAFAIWMLYGFFLDVPKEVEEAGLLDGLSELGVFRRVTMPMILPGLIATATLVFIFTWNEFFYAFVLTRETAKTFPTDIPGYFGAFRVEWGQMFSASVLGVLPPVIFGVLVRKWLARGLSGGTVG